MDIRDVRIDRAKTIDEKASSFVEQIRNPYHFLFGDTEVTLEFVGTESLEKKIINYLSKK